MSRNLFTAHVYIPCIDAPCMFGIDFFVFMELLNTYLSEEFNSIFFTS